MAVVTCYRLAAGLQRWAVGGARGQVQRSVGQAVVQATKDDTKTIVVNVAHGIAIFNDIADFKRKGSSTTSDGSPASMAGVGNDRAMLSASRTGASLCNRCDS